MKIILAVFVIGSLVTAMVANNKDTLGERIGQNIIKLRTERMQAYASSGSGIAAPLSVQENIAYLKRVTPTTCEKGHALLDAATTTYSQHLVSMDINQQLTQSAHSACQ